MSCTLSDFFHDSATGAEEHSNLNLISDIELEVNSEFSIKLGNPGCDADTDLVRNLLEAFFVDCLLHCFFSMFNGRLFADHAGIEAPWLGNCLLKQVLAKVFNPEPGLTRDMEHFFKLNDVLEFGLQRSKPLLVRDNVDLVHDQRDRHLAQQCFFFLAHGVVTLFE